jgi:hypothetical protein
MVGENSEYKPYNNDQPRAHIKVSKRIVISLLELIILSCDNIYYKVQITTHKANNQQKADGYQEQFEITLS